MTRLRLATAVDAEAMAAIYAPYVQTTAVTFEYDPPDPAEFRRRIAATGKDLPWLAAEKDGQVVGYAYASHFHARAAYAWAAELSIYLRQDLRGGGIGRQLYRALLALLQAQGYRTAFALVAHPNEGSEAFHRAMGFSCTGRLHDAGEKLGRLWDVAYWEMPLAELPADAPLPVPFPALSAETVQSILG